MATVNGRTGVYWRSVYIVFSVVAAVAWAVRMVWVWPDVAWQSQLLFIDDVDRILNRGVTFSDFWIGLGGDHALTGYRWFQYLSAALFGLSSHVETLAYAGLLIALALALGLAAFRQLDVARAGPAPRVLIFLFPVVLCSFAAAGSRGMEIGQFTGITAVVLLVLAVSSPRIGTTLFGWLAYIAGPVLTLLVLGSYVVPVSLALLALSAAGRVRPIASAETTRKLHTLTFSFVGSAVLWVALMLSSGANASSSGAAGLRNQISADWLFPLKYMLGSLAATVTNANTLEFVTVGSAFVYLAALLVLALIVLAALLAVRASHRSFVLTPAFLVLFGIALALTLMAGRNAGALWLLSPWYGFLFRLQLIGAIWLLAIGLSRSARVAGRPGIAYAALGVLGAVLAVYGLSNLAQWKRQPAERAFFQGLQNATLFPEELTSTGAGLSQLALPVDVSRHAVAVLARNRLSLYRDPKGLVRDSSAFDERRGVASSGLSPDGWVSGILRSVVMRPECRRAVLRVDPIQRLVPRVAAARSSVRLTSSFAPPETIQLGARPIVRVLRPSGSFPTISLRFSRTFNLATLGLSSDARDLSARVSIRCT